ncbi:putative motility protein [Hydrogenovibrio sp. JE_KL2]|nr:putative motility protein [Hydrogenovibrio sp. JE_KL2]
MQQGQAQQAAQISMLKKSMDMQSQGALALIESLPSATPSTQGLPPNLGNNINTTA